MKRKSLSLLLSGLLTVCLTGVGFASWLIVQGDEQQITGTVNVETISDVTTTITAKWQDNNKNGTAEEKTTKSQSTTTWGDDYFRFGYNNKTNSGWLRNTDTRGEILSLKLDVTVDSINYLASDVTIDLDVTSATIGNTGKTGVALAVEAGYITDFKLDKESVAKESAASFTLTISTSWGNHFGDKNPFDYYNTTDRKGSDTCRTVENGQTDAADADSNGKVTYAEDANYSLTNLYTWLSNVTFTVTITATV